MYLRSSAPTTRAHGTFFWEWPVPGEVACPSSGGHTGAAHRAGKHGETATRGGSRSLIFLALSFLSFLNNQTGRKWRGLVGTGGGVHWKIPQIHNEVSVTVAEVWMRSGFTETPQLTLHVFQMAGEEVRVGPPLPPVRGRHSPHPASSSDKRR